MSHPATGKGVAGRHTTRHHAGMLINPTAKLIVLSLGGYRAVAAALRIKPGAVRAWYRHGIPGDFHFDIIRIARNAEITISKEDLAATNANGRALRKTVARRKLTNPSSVANH